jgi:fatty acid desaturase
MSFNNVLFYGLLLIHSVLVLAYGFVFWRWNLYCFLMLPFGMDLVSGNELLHDLYHGASHFATLSQAN